MHRFVLFAIGMAAAVPAFAQDVPTGTGAVEEPAETPWYEDGRPAYPSEEERWHYRELLADQFRSVFLRTRKEMEAIRKKQGLLRDDRAARRRECREEIRRANRDTKVRVHADCYRDDLNFTLQLLQHDQGMIDILPSVPLAIRSTAQESATAFGEAVTAIIDALDANVYGSIEELLEAKRNLAQKYQLPFLEGYRQARVGHLLSWISHLLVRSQKVLEELPAGSGSTLKLQETQGCLIDVELQLWDELDKKYNGSNKTDLSQAQSDLKSCVRALEVAERLRAKELEPPATEQ